MQMTNPNEDLEQEMDYLVQGVLECTEDMPSNLLLNFLFSAYLTAAIDRGHIAKVPEILRKAAEDIDSNMQDILDHKAMHDAQSATMQ